MKRWGRRLLRLLGVLFVFVNIVTVFHAYKFTHFYNAGEVAVKPDSLKSGWDRTKEALFGSNFSKKKNDYLPDTTCQTVTLVTQDSLHLEAWYIPTSGVAKGTVALFHGHGGNKSGTAREAAAFRQLGYHTLLVDFRAHGGSQGNTCTIGVDEAEDVKLAYDYIVKRGEKNIVLWGISLGAASITKAVHDYDLKPAKVILEMPFASLHDAVAGRVKLMHLPAQPLAGLLTFWGGTMHGFWAFNNKPYLFAKKISCPVLLQWGAKDPRVKRSETEDIYNNLPGQKQLVVYENCGHESLYKKETDKWMANVNAFLQ
jgi:uncharacterized protein